MRIPYKHIAAAFAVTKPSEIFSHGSELLTWANTVHAVTDVLQTANPKFDRRRFLTAAGVLPAKPCSLACEQFPDVDSKCAPCAEELR